jgi:hypothetical protein
LNADCAPTIAADGFLRCLPSGVQAIPVGENYYLDSACLSHAGAISSSTCATPVYATGAVVVGCGLVETQVYRVSGSASQLYVKYSDTCSAVLGDSGYAVGNEMPASSFVLFTQN